MNLLGFKTSNKSFLNNILESNGTLGNKSYFIYIIIYIVMTPLILSKVEYFPDYNAYERFVESGIYYLLYREPLSAISMLLMTWFDLSAKEYYMFAWFFTSVLIFMIPVYLGKRYIVLSVFLILNPFTLILFQTPRSFMAYPLFVLALIITVRYRLLFISFATMFHILSGPYSAFILYIMKFKKVIFSFLLFLALCFLIVGAYGYYPHYIVKGNVHGQGRLLLFIIFIMTLVVISIKKNNVNIVMLLAILFFTILSYKVITPAARLIPYLFTVVVLYSFTKFKKIDSFIVIHFLYLIYIFISFYVVLGGMFGFGEV